MNDKKAHAQLKKIQSESNKYRNSRREKNERHEHFNDAVHELKKLDVVVKK